MVERDESGKRKLHPAMIPYKWEKGKSPNPGGRKKGTRLTAVIDRLLEKPVCELQQLMTSPLTTAIEMKAIRVILDPDPRVLQQFWDRHEGPVVHKTESKVEGAAPVQIYIPDNGRDDQAESEAREVLSDEG